ncbi:MAG: sugar phosphate isomerase/epimerase [Clostridia bacterium]|nr:sugar phosphate isomerase/epimerase [Oscillospiraceae bacterium]MDY5627727.1 sugar phosphate isomerase/epimerase [Clostridia bacterium]
MSNFKLGLQLYSVRDEMEKDMDACLKAVKEMGYECVEFAGFFGKSAEEVKAMLDKYGLEAVSSHQTVGVKDDEPLKPEDTVKYLNTLGVKYCAIPWYGKENYVNDWDGTMAKFKKSSEILKKGGIDLYYHNHDFEFDKINGKTIHEMIFDNLGLDVIKPELDVCWVHYAGYEPTEVMKKYSGRIEILHLKDFVCKNLGGGPVYALIDNSGSEKTKASKEDNGFEFRPVGYGIQDMPKIVEAAKECGIKYLIVEQDGHPNATSMEDAKKSIDYLKSIGL